MVHSHAGKGRFRDSLLGRKSTPGNSRRPENHLRSARHAHACGMTWCRTARIRHRQRLKTAKLHSRISVEYQYHEPRGCGLLPQSCRRAGARSDARGRFRVVAHLGAHDAGLRAQAPVGRSSWRISAVARLRPVVRSSTVRRTLQHAAHRAGEAEPVRVNLTLCGQAT